MTSQPQNRDFCLECRWEDFHLDGKNESGLGDQSRSQWDCLDQEHHTTLGPCEVDEACCDVDDCQADCQDDCPLECGSVCEGFVDCDASTVCSVAHCDDAHCDGNHCESTDLVCFEDHCCDAVEEQNCEFDSFFGLNTPLSLVTSGMMASASIGQNVVGETGKNLDSTLPAVIDPCYHQDFLSSYQAHATHCDQSVANHFECHDFQKDLQGIFPTEQLPEQTDVNPVDVFHLLGTCPDFSVQQGQFPQDHTLSGSSQVKNITSDPLNLFHPHPEHHHVHDHSHFKNPNDLNLNITRGPHRNHHRCRGHQHAHVHSYSPYSRQSRSSISSHILSSPGETPPPLDGGISSVLTTPDFSAEDNENFICKWSTKRHGVNKPCGAIFTGAGALQEHLVSSHMDPIDGAKGNGYYCCWDGCHRPDEPFSQKSKLQGHFLTHSNYKNFRCSVCGKSFARQATLDRHERSHRGDKPYKCKDCGKMFTDSSELKTHSRTHTGEKPFKCTFPGCDFETGDSSNMSSHRLTHGERKHKCPYPGCSKSFTRPDQLKRHQRTTHKEPSSTLPSPSPDHFTLTPFSMV
ncbi:Zinc finger C2H2 [Penicillium odoratum]|uniref:Zinc finger C2H2 n=1 Tax=Penicillium odoratum TaxID=1167516 RepID=UPI002546592E|nr:Zinc finger C2H2 [Penicillium odoratum]KAJ5777451.1 Zinc finger C2H2 [Penicillium odoratum]